MSEIFWRAPKWKRSKTYIYAPKNSKKYFEVQLFLCMNMKRFGGVNGTPVWYISFDHFDLSSSGEVWRELRIIDFCFSTLWYHILEVVVLVALDFRAEFWGHSKFLHVVANQEEILLNFWWWNIDWFLENVKRELSLAPPKNITKSKSLMIGFVL